MVTIQLRQLTVPPGHRIILQNISWQEFEEILTELGENRASRLAYYQGNLEIKMPLPKHEVAKVIIGDLVKIILEELEIDCECFGSTTFDKLSFESNLFPEPGVKTSIFSHVKLIPLLSFERNSGTFFVLLGS